MKIFFIIDSLRRHGAQRFLTHLAQGLRGLGYSQTVIVLNDASDRSIEEALAAAGCSIITIGRSALLMAGLGWWRLVALLRRGRPDIVMTMLDMADTLGRPAARLAGTGVLISAIRVRNLAKPALQRRLDTRTASWARKIVFNSREIVAYACETEGIHDEQVVVIPNGVEDLRTRHRSERDSSRQQLGISADTILLGAVGRLDPQKNFKLLLRIGALLSDAKLWKLAVIGDGPERGRLLRMTRELGLADRVMWLGARTDVETLLAGLDIFIHTADFEGMPNAVMEAMASGLPVIASDVDGTRDLIADGESGYLVPAGDARAFVDRVDQLMADPALARRLGENAHRRMVGHFGIAEMIRSYDELFRSLISSGNS